MSFSRITFGSLVVALFTVGALGCSSSTDPGTAPAPATPADAAGAEDQEHAGHAHGGDAVDDAATEEIAAALAELSDEDRAAARHQEICPVSDEPLGSMGKPVKVQVKDQDVFLCCASCKKRITDDPDTYLAKLKKAE